MRVFVTGATGFVGSAVVGELIGAGHRVVGLARSDANAEALTAAGAEPHRGSLDDPGSLRTAAAAADGVIHCAFIHDFSNYAASARADQRAIEAMGAALAGSDRPFVVTAGTAGVRVGAVVTEHDDLDPSVPLPRTSEPAALALVPRGVRASVVRLSPTVHGAGDHGFVPELIRIAREQGVSGYLGDGSSRWSAVHRLDAATLFRLALEGAPAGFRAHGVAEEGVASKDIAEAIGRHLDLPVKSIAPRDAAAHFGWIGRFFALDIPASNAATRATLPWTPTHPRLLTDLQTTDYFA